MSQERIGVGLNFQTENLSAYRLTYFQVPVSYKIKAKNGFLSFGLEAGVRVAKFDASSLNIKDENDQVLNELNSVNPDLSCGLFYRKKKYYLSFSIKHLLTYSTYDLQFEKKTNNRILYGTFAYR